MKYRLFLDDERLPPTKGERSWRVASNVGEAQTIIGNYGFPDYISFDHDLGVNTETGKPLETGYDFAKWLIDQDIEKDWWKTETSFNWYVHSQNPVGRDNINILLENYKANKFQPET